MNGLFRQIISFCFLAILITGCSQKVVETDENTLSDQSEARKREKARMSKTLEYGFQINGTDREYFDQYGVFTKLEVTRNGLQLFEHDYVEEFEIDNLESYVFKLDGQNSFELVFESTSPPAKPWLTLYRLENDKIVSMTKLPSMDVKPRNLDEDDFLEFAGYWSWIETYGPDQEYVSYNPLLVYEVTDTGIRIDSLLTMEINKEIWGNFEGYDFSDKISMDSEAVKKLKEIIERLKNQ
jgi:hypothetical protein